MTHFAIFRILGGEMPPRDVPGERVKALRWILEHEPRFQNTRRLWMLNSIPDPELTRQYLGLLLDADEYFLRRPISAEYRCDLPFEEKVRLAIDINGARNQCVSFGQKLARWTVVLDGDCFFNQGAWDELVKAIHTNEQLPEPDQVRYVSIPTRRLMPGDPNHFATDQLTEAMIAFRDDAEMRFDESRRFGDSPKQELLWRLGHSQERDQSHILLRSGLCISVSTVYHYAHGDVAELDHDRRGQLRRAGLEHLIKRLDESRRKCHP